MSKQCIDVSPQYDQDKHTVILPAKGWTRDLSNLPDISHKLIETYFCADNTAAYKHKREGYQLFKDGYVKQVRVMPGVQGDVKTLYAIKCTVTASMRAQKYEVKAHLCQETGVVLFGDCNCKSSAGVFANTSPLHCIN